MEISFSEDGNGFPVVLLHGFCETREIWTDFVKELSRNYRLLIPDLPGFGDSILADTDFSIADIGEEIFQWLQWLQIEKAIVIGHSLGGYVALELAKRHPEVLKGFGLFHSTAFADNQEKKSTRNKVIDFVRKNGVEVFSSSFVPQLFYYKNRKLLKSEIDKVISLAAKTDQENLIAYTRAMRDRNDRTDVLKSFDQPILIIAGENDESVALESIRTQQLLPKKAIVHIFEHTGHMGMFEKKWPALKAVKDFLEICLDRNGESVIR